MNGLHTQGGHAGDASVTGSPSQPHAPEAFGRSAEALAIEPGDQVELVDRLVLRPHVPIGTRGRVLKLVGFWGLAEVVFEGEPRPTTVKSTHLRWVGAVAAPSRKGGQR